MQFLDVSVDNMIMQHTWFFWINEAWFEAEIVKEWVDDENNVWLK